MLVWLTKFCLTWRSGYRYLSKGECNLNQSKDDFFVKRVAKNNSWNNDDRHKIHEIFLIKVLATERKEKSHKWSLVFKEHNFW